MLFIDLPQDLQSFKCGKGYDKILMCRQKEYSGIVTFSVMGAACWLFQLSIFFRNLRNKANVNISIKNFGTFGLKS